MRLATALQVSASIFVLATTSDAFAASPAEDLVAKWLKQTSFGANVAIGTSSFEPATQTVVLTDVVVSNQSKSFTMSYGTMRIEDPHLTGAGQFAAQSLSSEAIKVDFRLDMTSWVNHMTGDKKNGPTPDLDTPDPAVPETRPPIMNYAITADRLSYDRPVFPMQSPTYNPDGSVADFFFELARWSFESRADYFDVTNISVDTRVDGVDGGHSTTSYAYVFASGYQNGRLERMGGNDVTITQVVEGGQTITVTADEFYANGIDNGALVDVIDPKAFKDGKGDGKWRTIALDQGYKNLKFAVEGVDVSFGEIAAEGMRVRQTEKPIIPIFEKIFTDPQAMEKDPFAVMNDLLPNYFGLFGVDEFRITDLKVSDKDREYGHLGVMKISDFDSSGIGAISFKDAQVDAGPEFKGSFDLMNFNNIKFGEFLAWMRLGQAAETGGEPTPAMIRDAILDGSPTLDFFELSNVAVSVPEGDVSLTALTVAQGDYLRRFARRYDVNLYDLKMPLSLINDPPEARQELEAMGYDSVTASFFGTAQWDTEKGDVFFDDVTLKLKDMGVLSGSIHFGNIPLSIFDKPEELEARMQQGTFVGANLTFGNNSIVERTFEAQAKKLNQKPEDFRKNFASALPMMLTFLDDKDIQTRFQDVLVAFFTDPKSLVVSAKPDAPLSFVTMASMPDVQPPEIMDILNFKIEANK